MKLKKGIRRFLTLIFIILVGVGIYFYLNYGETKKTKVKVVSSIPGYGYKLSSNKSAEYKKLFAKLKIIHYLCILKPTEMKKWISDIWLDYRSEVVFGVVMVAIVVVSTGLSRFIPDDVYDNVLTPVLNVGTFTAAFACAWITFRHVENIRIRRAWGYALLIWGLGDLSYFV